jgi:hypothetical protein
MTVFIAECAHICMEAHTCLGELLSQSPHVHRMLQSLGVPACLGTHLSPGSTRLVFSCQERLLGCCAVWWREGEQRDTPAPGIQLSS